MTTNDFRSINDRIAGSLLTLSIYSRMEYYLLMEEAFTVIFSNEFRKFLHTQDGTVRASIRKIVERLMLLG